MPITGANVRELMLRGENETLDFKREHHDADPDLAKDLMSIANRLRKTSEPGYLLIGVDEDELGRGVFASERPVHADDDTYQQKVRTWLNPPLDFHFYEVPVDGFVVGVFEIKYTKRPIAAARGSGNKLQLGLAYRRRGTRNDLATAQEIVDWAREDNLLDNEAALLAVDDLRARVELAPAILGHTHCTQQGSELWIDLRLENRGNVAMVVRPSATWGTSALGVAAAHRHGGVDLSAERPADVLQLMNDAGETETWMRDGAKVGLRVVLRMGGDLGTLMAANHAANVDAGVLLTVRMHAHSPTSPTRAKEVERKFAIRLPPNLSAFPLDD